MGNYFEVKAKVKRTDELTGKEKRVSEQYLVDALSFTEAESKTTAKAKFAKGAHIVTCMSDTLSLGALARANVQKYQELTT